jgi:hypothetical protein
MLKTTMTLTVATLLLGLSVDIEPQGGVGDQSQWGTVKVRISPEAQAHVSRWEHEHHCNPSPCPKKKDRHKMGTGSVTE